MNKKSRPKYLRFLPTLIIRMFSSSPDVSYCFLTCCSFAFLFSIKSEERDGCGVQILLHNYRSSRLSVSLNILTSYIRYSCVFLFTCLFLMMDLRFGLLAILLICDTLVWSNGDKYTLFIIINNYFKFFIHQNNINDSFYIIRYHTLCVVIMLLLLSYQD